jgi:glycosyltransferase involved in cell wall biosynthesis
VRLHYLALHEPSGYAVSARRCMRALLGAGVELRWIPLVPGPGLGPGLGYRPAPAGEIGDPSLDDLLAGPEECDVAVAHLVPEYWPAVRARYPRARLVGHTVWETDRLPEHWPALLETADLIVVPTAWNQELLQRSGVRAPVHVVPHTAAAPRQEFSEVWRDIPSDAFVVYTIAPWTARKALDSVVRAYQSAFCGRDDTLLVIKTSPRDFTYGRTGSGGPVAPGTTAWRLAQLLAEFADPAPMHLVTAVLDDRDLDALHSRGDCYVSLCRSEGWGIPPFDAAAWGNPVVITGFGGQLDYLDAGSAFLVDYELVAVEDPAGGASYTPDQHWAEASVAHAAGLLRQVRAEPSEGRARAARARTRILREFAPPVVAQAFLAALAGSPSGLR